jgi:hypothetical protein
MAKHHRHAGSVSPRGSYEAPPAGGSDMKLEQLQSNAAVRGILSDALVTVVSVQWFGSEALELTYKTALGKVTNELLYRHDEARQHRADRGAEFDCVGVQSGHQFKRDRAR